MAAKYPRSPLAAAPLEQVIPRLAALLAKMKIDDIASVLAGLGAAGESDRKDGAGTLDEIARAILALPSGSHRLRDVERTVVAHALEKTRGNVSAAARLLGTDRKALERRIERHKIAVRRTSR